MNYILRTTAEGWYIAGLAKDTNFYTKETQWIVRGKFLNPDGTLQVVCHRTAYPRREQAEKACRKLARRKESMKKMVRMTLEDLPKEGYRHLEPDPDNWIDPDEMYRLLNEYRKERYVYFSDVMGIEDYYQVDVEYLAYITDDPDILEVIDKYGEKRSCLVARFSRVEETEMTEEANKLKM